jgi:flagellar biogenesis protein FliO
MDSTYYLKAFIALFFIISLILIVGLVFRKYFAAGLINKEFIKNKRLSIIETKFIDYKTKLLLVKLDNTEYLLLVGKEKDLIIDKISNT